jgi:Ca2+-binding RTX toxin-like protein
MVEYAPHQTETGKAAITRITYLGGGVPVLTITEIVKAVPVSDLENVTAWFQDINYHWDTYHGSRGQSDVLRGGTAPDTLFGWEGNDSLYGGADETFVNGVWTSPGDTLIGGAGDDFLDGGAGTNDLAYYDIERAYFRISKNTDGTIRVLDASVVEGVDTLKDVEFIRFSDGQFSVDQLLSQPEPPLPPAKYEAKRLVDVKEGEGLTFLIERTGTAIFEETVTFSFGGSAVFGRDYKAPLNVTFLPGEREKAVTLTTVADGLAEKFETITLTLAGTSNGGVIIGGPATAGIVNIDQTIKGTSRSNTLKGFEGNDKLYGYGGNDKLYGGTGNDELYGGTGKDAFYFDTLPHSKGNKDKIKDFNVIDDVIRLDNAVFLKVGSNGGLKSSAFWSNNSGKVHDKSDRVIYDKDSGVLYYDADGTGKGAAIALATISKNLAMTNKDFVII